MSESYKVLIIDDDGVLRSSLQDVLEERPEEFRITHAENGKRGLSWIEQKDFDIVFLDIDLPLLSGMDVLRRAAPQRPHINFILMTAYGRIPDVVEALKIGAYTYLEKPLREETLAKIFSELKESRDLAESVSSLSPVVFEHNKELVGSTNELNKVLQLIKKISQVNTAVLVLGESGTGKELVARALHYNSPRRSAPFVTVNCSAVVENLFESEFFGHEKGSFTGADSNKIGKFQYAEGGTLFLDEIGDLSLANQVKLLRALQEKTYTPVGSHKEFPFDVRIVAATHKNLEEMVKEGDFRQDLYFRLNIMTFKLPSLKERRPDIPELMRSFIEKFNKKHQMSILGWKPDFLEAILDYDFPGNIRELENMIERAFVLSEGRWLDFSALPDKIRGLKNLSASKSIALHKEESTYIDKGPSSEIIIDSEKLDFQKNKEDFEKKFIIEALKRNKGRLNQTALEANIPKKTLQRKMQKYGICLEDFKKND